MPRFSLRAFVLASSCLLATACTSTASVKNVAVASAPAASAPIVVAVEQDENNERGEARALENGLVRAFREAGYEIGEGGIVVHARITKVARGSTIANAVVGMGIGRDSADVAVHVDDANGKRLMFFTVHGEAVDKRYRDLHDVLTEDVPQKVRDELLRASR